MALNDRDPTLGGFKAVDVYPGVANPTAHSSNGDPISANFVNDPTSDNTGAGAAPNFDGGAQAQRAFNDSAGVVEGRPGIIESTNIDPLDGSAGSDRFASATQTPGSGSGGSGLTQGTYDTANAITGVASGAAKLAYGTLTGDETTRRAGEQVLYGERE